MRYKICLVSYLNAKPFVYGIESLYLEEFADIDLAPPAECARRLINNEVDIALVPVAVIPKVPGARIITDWCIGADGEVKTVCIFAQKPIQELKYIYLDPESETSNLLAELLLNHYWHLPAKLIEPVDGYEHKIRDDVGGIIIGDRAIEYAELYSNEYDLAKVWKQFTGLPFVFAAWVSNKPIEQEFIDKLDECLAHGVSRIPHVAQLWTPPAEEFSMENYFSTYIQYNLDHRKKEALQTFLRMTQDL